MTDILKELVKLRRDFHSCAEIGWLEFETTIKIISYLKSVGLKVIYGKEIHSTRMGLPKKEKLRQHREKFKDVTIDFNINEILEGYTGAIGILDTKKSGPTIALRFDIDANELDEAVISEHKPYKEDFISKNKGMMHGCGHDGHIATGLVLARYMTENVDKLNGRFIFIFQPAEEGVRGARSLVGAGVVDKVDYILSGHIGFNAKKNQIFCGVRGFYATSKIDVYFYGEPSHAGACPELGKNALLAAANCTINLHTLTQSSKGLSRVNVGVLNAGSARNIVPSFARLKIETRGENQIVNEELVKKARHIIEGSALLYDVRYEVDLVGSAPAYNHFDEEFIDYAADLIREDKIEVVKDRDFGASEDATYMLRRVEEHGGKSLYLIFGTNLSAPHHNSLFDFEEEDLLNSFNAYVRLVEGLST